MFLSFILGPEVPKFNVFPLYDHKTGWLASLLTLIVKIFFSINYYIIIIIINSEKENNYNYK